MSHAPDSTHARHNTLVLFKGADASALLAALVELGATVQRGTEVKMKERTQLEQMQAFIRGRQLEKARELADPKVYVTPHHTHTHTHTYTTIPFNAMFK